MMEDRDTQPRRGRLGVEIAFPTQTLWVKRGGETAPEALDDAFAGSVVKGEERVREDVRQMVDAALGGEVPPPVGFGSDGGE